MFLRPDLTPAGRLRSDLRALGIADRARLLVEIVVPPRAYMRAVHGDGGWLPWLYVRRVAAGAGSGCARSVAPGTRNYDEDRGYEVDRTF